MIFKQIIKKILFATGLHITKNMQYDKNTISVLKKVLKPDSNCIDVGCHKGEILDIFLQLSPQGEHFAFEPLPDFFRNLKAKYSEKVRLFDCALSDKCGKTSFQYVKNAPAYSGLKKRAYTNQNPDIQEITVSLNKLDDIIRTDIRIDLIKIDVEGAEFHVLKGSFEILKRNKPVIIFEFGLGAADFYGTNPEDIFSLLENAGLKISLLKDFIKNRQSIDLKNFKYFYETNKEYYFVASP